MIWYVLPIKEGMSWEGHLSGFIVGLILAVFYRKSGVVKEKYQFSKTDFDDMFDDVGNYIPPEIIDNVKEKEEITRLSEIDDKYLFKEDE